ncbi:MAG TPA: nuclear transport factor 2 family protein [Vicinamibacterales bacterium]|nr:nuclear transport factor 2 family protein [Vicinamibacterales bacterium]
MTRALTSTVLLGLLFVSACSAPPPAPPPPPPDTTAADTAALNQLRSDFEAGWKAGDADKLAALVAPNVVSMADTTPTVSGKDAWLAAQKAQFAQVTVNDVSLKSDELKLMGNYAFDAGTFDVTITPKTPKAKPMTMHQRYMVILHKEPDGVWRLYRDIDNAVPAAGKK